MKPKSQLELIKSVRKPVPPATKVERPEKGGGYKRRPKHKKKIEED
jgi:hypothetical protein